ncbi:MAG: helix-turn-helix transcriptional regulator [Candidatus Baltobacteraceae bacterium]
MHADRFFQSTRGRIVEELRRRGSASAADLAASFNLSPNAVRQQLIVLERDGLVVERSVRRGPTKPTLEFSLTPLADRYFPQAYDRMLSAVLRELREQHGPEAVERLFEGIANRTLAKVRERITGDNAHERAAQLGDVLREQGVSATVNLIEGGVELREHHCPYSEVSKENPEVCSVIHRVIDETIGEHAQTESIATGGRECRFEVRSATAAAAP